MIKKTVIAVLFCCLLIACSNVKDLRFTKTNQDEVMEKVRKSKDLTGEEVGALMGALMRVSMSGSGLEGKSVGDLIKEQKKIMVDAEAKEKEAKRLADEAAKKEAAIAAELIKYISAAPFKKSFTSSDYRSGTFEDTVNLAFVFENKSNKDIRAFKGTTIFKDLFGEKIKDVNMSYDEGIKAGEKKNWNGQLKYNQFIPEMRKFKDTELSNMKFEWQPKAIVFADGSTLGIEEDKK